MNELTRKLVVQTARQYPRSAKLNSDAFLSKLQFAYADYIATELLIPLKFRALKLWQNFHPEHFDDGFLDNWEIEEAISLRVERITDFTIRNRPELQLDDYGDLPRQVAHPAIPYGVEAFYQPELDWCISYMAKHPNTEVDTLMKQLVKEFAPIPPIAAEKTACYAVNIRGQKQTIGLPLFDGLA